MPTSRSDKKLIVITGGDPRGIGPEIILKSLKRKALLKNADYVVVGDYGIFRKSAKALSIDISSLGHTSFVDLKNASVMAHVSRGVSIVKAVKNSALVTAPIEKFAINKAGYKFGGHTEFLAHETASQNVTMMMVGGALRVSLVTRHLPLKSVPAALSEKEIIRTAENTYYALRRLFKVRRPRIGIAALNPHAGEKGLLGREERAIILPAVKRLQKIISGVEGPLPADTLFYKAKNGQFDAVVSMYHDQGLIPLKMLAFESGVNLTIGLPFIRTSPDHGTAFDIAGKGKANPSSMIEAIKLAAELC